jgi:hypothetical protein
MRFYIHAFSARNHSNYCLAYAFTYRDMQDFQGIAWIKVINYERTAREGDTKNQKNERKDKYN